MAAAKTPAPAPASKFETKDDPVDTTTAAGTPGTPEGAGTAYTNENSATENTNGKASATPAGGNPVTSPVIGNPGESRPDMGYDYGLAASPAASTPLKTVDVLAAAPAPDPRDQLIALLTQQLAAAQAGAAPAAAVSGTTTKVEPRRYATRVRAVLKGHYGGLREAGDVFENDMNLPTRPEDPNSWFESAE